VNSEGYLVVQKLYYTLCTVIHRISVALLPLQENCVKVKILIF